MTVAERIEVNFGGIHQRLVQYHSITFTQQITRYNYK